MARRPAPPPAAEAWQPAGLTAVTRAAPRERAAPCPGRRRGCGHGAAVAARVAARLLAAAWLVAPAAAQDEDEMGADCENYMRAACVEEVRREALAACQEYQAWNLRSVDCDPWADIGERRCLETCGNCTTMAQGIREQCLFTAMNKGVNYYEAQDNCELTYEDFRVARCPSSIIDDYICYSQAAEDCITMCGNYRECDCFRDRDGYGDPDVCIGYTMLDGLVEGFDYEVWHDCSLKPRDCYNHRPNTLCGIYKYCPENHCLVKQIVCPLLDSCEDAGVCDPSSGDCYYAVKQDGAYCEDGVDYTHADVCMDGQCTGTIDYCKRDLVNCVTTNPCMRPDGTCDPDTGHCIFVPQLDGYPCRTVPGGPVDGYCSSALCRLMLDRCFGVICPYLGECYEQSECNEETGQCSAVSRVENWPCSDTPDGSTGRCINGHCVASPEVTVFQNMTEQACTDLVESNAPRYYGTLSERSECERQCLEDWDCQAYSFGFYVCSIFVTQRSTAPDMRVWGKHWDFHPEAVPSVKHFQECATRGTEEDELPVDLLEVAKTIASTITIAFLVIVPLVWVMLLLKCCPSTQMEVDDGPQTFGGNFLHFIERFLPNALLPTTQADLLRGLTLEEQELLGLSPPESPKAGGESSDIAAAPEQLEMQVMPVEGFDPPESPVAVAPEEATPLASHPPGQVLDGEAAGGGDFTLPGTPAPSPGAGAVFGT